MHLPNKLHVARAPGQAIPKPRPAQLRLVLTAPPTQRPSPSASPTKEEISTILRPWQSDNMRRRAWCAWQVYTNVGGNNPLLLRTWYDPADDPADDERVDSWATLSEEFADDADWAILDDGAVFDFGAGPWQRVLENLPEIAIPYKTLRLDTSAGKTGARTWMTISSTLVQGRVERSQAVEPVVEKQPEYPR